MRPIPRKSPLSTLGINTNFCQVLSSSSVPMRNYACTISTTFLKLVVPGSFSLVALCNQWWRCSTRIPDVPPKRFSQSLRTPQAISSYLGTYYTIGNGLPPTGIGFTGDGMCLYRSTSSSVMWFMVTLAGGGGRSTDSLYHPRIQIHISLVRDGSEARRESTADPVSDALRRRSSWSLALIFRLSVWTRTWYLSRIRRSAILVSMIC